jgi:hypothetical protein
MRPARSISYRRFDEQRREELKERGEKGEEISYKEIRWEGSYFNVNKKDMNSCDTRTFHFLNGTLDVKCASKSSIDIDQKRQLRDTCNAARVLHYVI